MGNNGSRKAANAQVEGSSESDNAKTVHTGDEDNEPQEGSSSGQTNKIRHENNDINKLLLRGVKPGSLLEKVILAQPDRTKGLGIIDCLPDELILHILSFLSIYDLVSLSGVSRSFFMLFSDDLLWKVLYLNGMNSFVDDAQRSQILLFYKKKKATQKGATSSIRRKQERKVQYMGSWHQVCQLNFCRFEDEYEEGFSKPKKNGNKTHRKRYFIVNEGILGWPVKMADDIFESPDDVTHVSGGPDAEYHYYNNVGIGVFFEDRGEGLVAVSVLKRIEMEDVGTAYQKIIPPFYRDKILETWKKQTGNSSFSF
eukprot:TRINITY_DN25470_c0_g1_i2.p1 TRINITY_DN25470_c0_g1~~TRINITY_DN25470_c0_g1_i2.p1  ORF type:complete len:312 (-),score=54.59 TRINITY_DN25470_c0_g1_i2:35-970(-)